MESQLSPKATDGRIRVTRGETLSLEGRIVPASSIPVRISLSQARAGAAHPSENPGYPTGLL